jgi:hypothetical protein
MNYLSYIAYNINSSRGVTSIVLSGVPLAVGGLVFMTIGLYMMKSGVKKEDTISKVAEAKTVS